MTEPDVTLCVLGSKPHRATVGFTCDQHLQRLADTLRDIEQEAAILSAVPSMAVRSGRGGSLPSHRSPAVLDAIVATDKRRGTGHVGSDYEDPWGLDDTASVLDVLGSWARLVREERNLSLPRVCTLALCGVNCICGGSNPTHPTRSAQPTVSGERDLLSRSLSWICGQEWVDEFAQELHTLLGQLRATNGTAEPKPKAQCFLCDGPIVVNEVDGYVYCGGDCGLKWTPADLAATYAVMERDRQPRTDDGRAMMTVAQIVERFGGNAKAVRMRLARYGVTAVDGHYDPAIFEKVGA